MDSIVYRGLFGRGGDEVRYVPVLSPAQLRARENDQLIQEADQLARRAVRQTDTSVSREEEARWLRRAEEKTWRTGR